MSIDRYESRRAPAGATWLLGVVASLVMIAGGCGEPVGANHAPATPDPSAPGTSEEAIGTQRPQLDCSEEGGRAMTITVTSSAFEQCEPIPRRYTGEGEDVSPPIAWSELPEGTRELVLICDDPDAPGAEPWVHWVIYKIPATLSGLSEGVPPKPRLTNPSGALQGRNSWPKGVGYRGPLPPPGAPHRYRFTVFALKVKMVAEPGMTKQMVINEIRSHIIGEVQLIGVYER